MNSLRVKHEFLGFGFVFLFCNNLHKHWFVPTWNIKYLLSNYIFTNKFLTFHPPTHSLGQYPKRVCLAPDLMNKKPTRQGIRLFHFISVHLTLFMLSLRKRWSRECSSSISDFDTVVFIISLFFLIIKYFYSSHFQRFSLFFKFAPWSKKLVIFL